MNEMSAGECKRAIGDLLALIDIENKGFDGIDERFLNAIRKAESDEGKLAAGELVEAVHPITLEGGCKLCPLCDEGCISDDNRLQCKILPIMASYLEMIYRAFSDMGNHVTDGKDDNNAEIH